MSGDKPYKESMSGKGTAQEQAEEAWQYCRSRSNSALHSLFTGQLQTCTTCPACGHRSLKFDEFQSLKLRLPHTIRSAWFGVSIKVQLLLVLGLVPHSLCCNSRHSPATCCATLDYCVLDLLALCLLQASSQHKNVNTVSLQDTAVSVYGALGLQPIECKWCVSSIGTQQGSHADTSSCTLVSGNQMLACQL